MPHPGESLKGKANLGRANPTLVMEATRCKKLKDVAAPSEWRMAKGATSSNFGTPREKGAK